jgi:hypothetical protein
MLAANNLSDVASAASARANLGLVVPPQGRLTLTSGVPVLTSDVTAAATIYCTPYVGQLVPIYDGSQFIPTVFSELSLALDSSSGHTGYHQSGKNFDLFVVNDAGTIRLASGPAWSSDTARGTDAGTTELERKNGLLTNKNSITVRFGSSSGDTLSLAANKGTYVGTFRASANGQTQVKFGSSAAGGGEAWLGLWNAYGRVQALANVRDSTSSWTYAGSTVRNMNNSATNRVSLVSGLAEDGIEVKLRCRTQPGSLSSIGIGLNATAAYDYSGLQVASVNQNIQISAAYAALLGFNYFQACEGTNGNSATFTGGGGEQALIAALKW